MSHYKRYPKYKDSGVEWLGAVPEHWEQKPFFAVTNEPSRSNSGMIEDNVLSLSFGRIIPKPVSDNRGLVPDSYETYQIVEPKEIVFRLTDLQNDKRSLRSAIAQERGIITSAYLAVTTHNIDPEYVAWLMRAYDICKVFYSMGGGLRQSLKYWDMKYLPITVPAPEEQNRICRAIEKETTRIDALIEKKTRFIKLLKEKRQALITQAVTKGLDPNVKMKDSGVEWLGEVPEHSVVKSYRYATRIFRGKFSHRPRNDPALYGGAHPFIQTGDVAQAHEVIEEFSQTLNDEGTKASIQFPKGTLVMAIAANIGDVAILGFPAYCPDSVVGFKPEKDIDLEYLRYSFIAAVEALKGVSTQSTQGNLNVDRVGAVKAMFPPLDVQRTIVDSLKKSNHQIDSLVASTRRSIDLLKERRSALITAAVTGQIDLRDAA